MASARKRACLCAPTTHPGSFRCSQHRNSNNRWGSKILIKAKFLKEFLMQIIKPSKHHLNRRRNFQPKPSRFSLIDNTNNSNNPNALSSSDGLPVS